MKIFWKLLGDSTVNLYVFTYTAIIAPFNPGLITTYHGPLNARTCVKIW